MTVGHARALLAEAIGCGLLVTVVVGSGIAASRLTDDIGVQLLANSAATALGLVVLILLLAPVSGAHFNPVVTLVDAGLPPRGGRAATVTRVAGYVVAQVVGAVGGSMLANAMFEVPVEWSSTMRVSTGALVGEVVATAGLVLLVFGLSRSGAAMIVGPAVGAYIGAAYWFTSSTAFANPAVTIGRIFTESFAGIAPSSVLPFLAAQFVGAAVGALAVIVLFPRRSAGQR